VFIALTILNDKNMEKPSTSFSNYFKSNKNESHSTALHNTLNTPSLQYIDGVLAINFSSNDVRLYFGIT